MSREEFLEGLEEALAGEVPASVIRENLNYYNSYISQEMAKGRTVDEIVDEIGEPRIVARTIIDSSEAAGEAMGDGYGAFEDAGSTYESRTETSSHVHYSDLSKWYWKLLLMLAVFVVFSAAFRLLGGIFALLVRFAGPVLMLLLVWWFIKSLRR